MKRILFTASAIGFALACLQSCSKDEKPTTPPTVYTKVPGTVKDVDGNGYDVLEIIPASGITTGKPAGTATVDTMKLKDPAKAVTLPIGSVGTIVSPNAQYIPSGQSTLSSNLVTEHYADGKPLVQTNTATLGGTYSGTGNNGTGNFPSSTTGTGGTGTGGSGTGGTGTTTQGSSSGVPEATMGGTSGQTLATGAPAKSCYNNSSLNCDSIGALYTNEAVTGMNFTELLAWNQAQGDKNGDGYIDLSDDSLNYPVNPAEPYSATSQFSGTTKEGLWVKNAVVQKGPQGACPSGYHIPTDGEWKQLEMSLGMPVYDVDKEGIEVDRGASTSMGEKLATALGLKYGGYTSVNNTYAQLKEVDIFWTSTAGVDKNGPYVYVRYIYKNQFKGIIRKRHYEKSGLSVRCFKDL